MEVAHLWAAQYPEQEWARCSNLSYSGNTISSYGWWPMAVIQPDGVVLVRNWTYSSSTSKHMSCMRQAINHLEKIYCPDPSSLGASTASFMEKLRYSFNDYQKARKKTPHIHNNESIYKEFKTYLEYLKQPMPEDADKFRLMLVPDVPGILFKEESRRVELEAQRPEKDALNKTLECEADRLNDILNKNSTNIKEDREQAWLSSGKITKETPESIKRWKVSKGKLIQYVPTMRERGVYYGRLEFPITRIRIVDSKVETSRGATVPVSDAKRLWELMKQKVRLMGERCGSFTVTNWNGNLRIGCHEIEKEEIKRFILYYGWDNEQVVFETLGL